MSDNYTTPAEPRAHIRMVFLGHVAPHWEIESRFGDRALVEEFRSRALARLVLITHKDPQFKRNKARIDSDAEREGITIEWDRIIEATQLPR
jgi:hypothetical protein